MNINFIDKNKTITTILLSLFILFTFSSFILITNKYQDIEKEINTKDISNLIYKIQSQLEFNHKLALSFSTSDEVYNFLENKNQNYIFKNFRKGSYTLEDVGLSYYILTNKENKIKFSTYKRGTQIDDIKNFEVFITNDSKELNTINKVIIYKSEAYYLSKTPIYKIDYENISNGFLYTGSKIDIKKLTNLSHSFNNIKFISNSKIKPQTSKLNNKETSSFKTIIHKEIKNNLNYNEISFYNNHKDLIFTIRVKSIIKNINHTKEISLIIFLGLASIAIFILLYISTSYRRELKSQQESIALKIQEEAKELNTKIQELEKANKKLYKIAHTDFLTKTMNRRSFFTHAQNHFNFAKKNDEILSVIMIDIDNFKKFNDKYGHSVGDKVLILFANKIRNLITEKTIFGRLGGEEFALIVKNTNLEDTIIKAEKLKKSIEEIKLVIDQERVKITASFGVSDNSNCNNIDEMLQQADTQLYNAKESGKNVVRSRLNFC